MIYLTPDDYVFISGPMTGIHNYNRPAFFAAEEKLKPTGCVIMNPAALKNGESYQWYMRHCLHMLANATAMVQLPGWRNSPGARLENDIAKVFGLRIVEVTND